MYKIIRYVLTILLSIAGAITAVYFSRISSLYIFSLLISLGSFLFYTYIKNRYIEFIITIIVLFIFIANLIIIPLSFYITWFQFIQNKIPDSHITVILIYLICFILGFFLGMFNKRNSFQSIFFLIMFLVLFAALLFNKGFLFIIIIGLLPIFLVFKLIYTKQFRKILPILLFIIFIFYLSLLIFNNSTQKESKLVNNSSYNIRKVLNTYFKSFNLMPSIPGLSRPYASNSGKPPILTTSALLKITGYPGDRFYLRMKIDNKYENYELSKKLEIDNKNAKYIELTVMADFLPIIPTTLETTNISGFDYPNNMDKTLKLSLPLSKADKIKLIISKNYVDETEFILNKPELSDRMQKLAESLKGKTDRETINNIRKYLFNNYVYSLETQEDREYISKFLFETKTGFCIHFARSFILLATENDILTREISGYLVDIPNIENNYMFNTEHIITEKNSHLWPEVFIDGRWETFEVTPPLYRENNRIVKKNNNLSKPEDNKLEEKVDYKKNYLPVFLTLFIVIITVIIFIYILNKNKYLLKIIKISKRKKIPHPKDIGWVLWNKKIKGNEKTLKILLEYAYKGIMITKNDYLYIKNTLKLL
ncbi:MAG: hypothetical protein OCD02_18965 [Spirochaetaceae bacterium]